MFIQIQNSFVLLLYLDFSIINQEQTYLSYQNKHAQIQQNDNIR
jgi:hypothetical protein